MSFKKNKYTVIKNFVSKDVTKFIYDYFLFKRKAVKYMYDAGFPPHSITGTFEDEYVPDVYCAYGDFVLENILEKSLPNVEKATGYKLYPTYSYMRVYEKGSELKRHTDRPSCEISTTINFGGDPWPIFVHDEKKDETLSIDLKPGDGLFYRGCILPHWREKFKGDLCVQAFFHYNDKKGPLKDQNKFDRRPLLGLPLDYRKD